MSLLLVIASAFLSFLLTGAVRRYAQKHILDIPNARSSHTRPTPRGGGIAIVLTFMIAVGILWWWGGLKDDLSAALLGGGLIAAVTGFLDDHRHVPSGIRLILHIAAAIWIVALSGGMQALDLGFGPLALGIAGSGLAVVALVWMLNLYNFMDGIDGIAGSQAVSVSVVGACLMAFAGQPGVGWAMLVLGAASAGFLVWNWPPARIFMGDAGSGFLGLMLGGFGLVAIQTGQTPWPWIILMGVFLVDATVTLVRRAIRGVPVYQAHRSHAYQNLSRRWGSHLHVTRAVILVNILWLAPWAFVARAFPAMGWLATLVALAPLIMVVIRLRAGLDELPCPAARTE